MRTQALSSLSNLTHKPKKASAISKNTWKGRAITKGSKKAPKAELSAKVRHILSSLLPEEICEILDTFKFNPGKIIRKLGGKIEKAPAFLQTKLQNIGYTVTALDLHDLKLTSEHIKHIVRYFPNLMEINATNSTLDDSCMEEIAKLEKLRKLNLAGCNKLTDTGIAKLKPLSQLLSLDLTACYLLTKLACETLATFTQITDLNLTLCGGLSNEALDLLKPLTALTHLNLSRNNWLSVQGLEFLKHQKLLESLDLSSCPKLSADALHLLSQHRYLKTLNLELNEDWLKKDSLEVLIQSLPNLEVLNISHNQSLLDNDIALLAALKKLKKLEIFNCTEITEAGRTILKSENRQLEVIFEK